MYNFKIFGLTIIIMKLLNYNLQCGSLKWVSLVLLKLYFIVIFGSSAILYSYQLSTRFHLLRELVIKWQTLVISIAEIHPSTSELCTVRFLTVVKQTDVRRTNRQTDRQTDTMDIQFKEQLSYN